MLVCDLEVPTIASGKIIMAINLKKLQHIIFLPCNSGAEKSISENFDLLGNKAKLHPFFKAYICDLRQFLCFGLMLVWGNSILLVWDP